MIAGLDRLEGLFGDQWGKMLEALVQPSALRLFQARGLQVRRLHQRSKAQLNGGNMEVDLILENGSDLVVVEVKSKLNLEAVDDLLADLAQFTEYFPNYRGYNIYGAVAGLHITESADRYAYRRGLFILAVGGEGMVQMLNDANFKPRNFAPQAQ
jgi:predicted AAA+ superfamily ATPase